MKLMKLNGIAKNHIDLDGICSDCINTVDSRVLKQVQVSQWNYQYVRYLPVDYVIEEWYRKIIH